MSVKEIQLYNALKNKLGEEESSLLVEFIQEEMKTELNNKMDRVLVKEDKVDLIKWMVALWLSSMGIIISVIKFL